MKCSAFLALVVSLRSRSPCRRAPERRQRVVPAEREARPRGPRRHDDPARPCEHLLAGPTRLRQRPRASRPPCRALDAAPLRHRRSSASSPSTSASASPPAATRGCSRTGSASSCARSEASPASAASASSSRAECLSASSPATTCGARSPTAVDPVEPAAATTRDVQQELVDLGFMAPSGLTGAVDLQTSTALLGFQKWIGLPRDGSLGPRRRSRPSNAPPGPSRSSASQDAGSKCSCAGSSRS